MILKKFFILTLITNSTPYLFSAEAEDSFSRELILKCLEIEQQIIKEIVYNEVEKNGNSAIDSQKYKAIQKNMETEIQLFKKTQENHQKISKKTLVFIKLSDLGIRTLETFSDSIPEKLNKDNNETWNKLLDFIEKQKNNNSEKIILGNYSLKILNTKASREYLATGAIATDTSKLNQSEKELIQALEKTSDDELLDYEKKNGTNTH